MTTVEHDKTVGMLYAVVWMCHLQLHFVSVGKCSIYVNSLLYLLCKQWHISSTDFSNISLVLVVCRAIHMHTQWIIWMLLVITFLSIAFRNITLYYATFSDFVLTFLEIFFWNKRPKTNTISVLWNWRQIIFRGYCISSVYSFICKQRKILYKTATISNEKTFYRLFNAMLSLLLLILSIKSIKRVRVNGDISIVASQMRTKNIDTHSRSGQPRPFHFFRPRSHCKHTWRKTRLLIQWTRSQKEFFFLSFCACK